VITAQGQKFYTNGERQDLFLGMLVGKMAARVGLGQHGHVKDFIDFAQNWLGRERVLFYTWLETGGWSPVAEGRGMFGAPPRDPGMWDVEFLRNHWDHNDEKTKRVKPEHLTPIYKSTIEWFFKTSVETGACFVLGIVATLKHTDGIGNGHLDHIIRQTLELAERLQDKYPKACVIMHCCNEWDANNGRETPFGPERIRLSDVNMWAYRRVRDSYWENGQLFVDHGGRDTIQYNANRIRDPNVGHSGYDAVAIHPVRKNAGRDWTKPPDRKPLVMPSANPLPICNTENMYYITRPETTGWYRNAAGWNLALAKQIIMYSHWADFYDMGIFHADWIMQVDHEWPGSMLEAYQSEVANLFGGGNPPDPPKPKHKYERIIALAYHQILGRQPDPVGLAHYNEQMVSGMSEWMVRESMIRSDEYDKKN
jgi:hypothetical protein